MDRAAAQEMIRTTGQRGVPVIVVGSEVVVGFDRQRLEELLARQPKAGRPSLGLSVADAASIARQQGAVPIFGAYVGAVRAGSPSERSGLRKEDIITELNMRPVRTAQDLEEAVAALQPGARVRLVFLRGEETLAAEFTL